jgi:hypothetical protein
MIIEMNLDLFKEIQCKEPCWDNKAILSDVFRDEKYNVFHVGFTAPFP